jgi:endoglucanase
MAEGFRLTDRLTDCPWANQDHIYVILDMHFAPGGQTGTNIDDSRGYPWLYQSPWAQREAISVWRRTAARYARNPTVPG